MLFSIFFYRPHLEQDTPQYLHQVKVNDISHDLNLPEPTNGYVDESEHKPKQPSLQPRHDNENILDILRATKSSNPINIDNPDVQELKRSRIFSNV